MCWAASDSVPRDGEATVRTVPRWLYLPAALGIAVVLLPLVAILVKTPWAHFWSSITSHDALTALELSLRTAALSTAGCLVLGVPLAIVFAHNRTRWMRVTRAVVLLPLVLPPVVGGLALLYVFGRQGMLGKQLHAWGIDIAFSTTAVVLAQLFVSLPFVVITVEGALRTVGDRYDRVAATLGASPARTLGRVTLPLIAPALASGTVLAFARALGEFGATITFAGNLPGVTQTAPLAIYVDQIDDPAQALPMSVLLVAVALIVVIAVHARESNRQRSLVI
jgi:molybdate transport system permease protein